MKSLSLASALVALTCSATSLATAQDVTDIGDRRELFVDQVLVESMKNAQLVMHRPHDEGVVVPFDKPWEGPFCGYATVITDGDLFRLYYRGLPESGKDGNEAETTCYAESKDGISWTKPNVGLFEVRGYKDNNVVMAQRAPVTHNFSPFLDSKPGSPQSSASKRSVAR